MAGTVDIGNLQARLTMDKSGFDKGLSGAQTQLSSVGDKLQKFGPAIGAAMTAAGVAIIGLTDKAKKQNAELTVTATQLGKTTEEMRKLALETTNVTFPLSEVTATFDLLTRAGETNTETIQKVATQYDTLGDAIGKTASEVTGTMTVAMKTWNLTAEESTAYLDDMTYLLRNTTLDMDNFNSVVGYTTPEVVGLGLGLDDTIAALGVMEGKGMAGAVATREWRSAVTAADGDLNNFYASLGITAEEIDAYKTQMEGADGITQQFADAANTQYGFMDKLRQSWDEFTLSAGSALEPLEGIGAMMAAGGPMLMGISTLPGMIGPVTTALKGLNFAMLTSPLFLIAAAIAGIILVLVYLESEFGLVTKAFEFVSGAIGSFIGWITEAVDWTGLLEGAFEGLKLVVGFVAGAIIGYFTNMWNAVKMVINFVIDGINTMIGALNSIRFDVPDWIPGIGGASFGFNLNTIPRLAEGGIVTEPTIAMIGEAGPEAVVPLSGGGAGGGINITVENMNVRDDKDIKLIADELYTLIDRKNRARGVV